jgi:neutral ceramidase
MHRRTLPLFVAGVILSAILLPLASSDEPTSLQVGTAVTQLQADDSMVIAGGIGPRTVQGQEGELRATAIVLAKADTKVAVVSCDVLMLTRDLLDPVAAEIERTCGIPASNVMIHSTHTHHAPSTIRVHGYDRDAKFCTEVQQAIVKAVCDANNKVAPATFWFEHAGEATVGQNSRLLLADNTVYWVGARDDAVRPTGPFDPDLPVLAFRDTAGKNLAVIFGHSTHTIGALTGNFRSPAFYGMAAQRMEQDLGGTFCFLEGASGSTHLLDGKALEASQKIEATVRAALISAQEQKQPVLAAMKKPFEFHVRTFDEQAEEKAVTDYCTKRIGAPAPGVTEVFRNMRSVLAPQQGELRTTWVQVIRIGDVAIVGVPAEFFTVLGVELKRRSPLPHTYIAELSNDWIGYLPDREGHQLGGYQVWTGFHSYAEPGTGERVVDMAVDMLKELTSPQ